MDKIAGKKGIRQVLEWKTVAVPCVTRVLRNWVRPDIPGIKSVALDAWVKLAGLFGAVCACFRRPGISEASAVLLFGTSAVGAITSFFWKKARRLMPLFSALAAAGAVIVILRCFFPRNRD